MTLHRLAKEKKERGASGKREEKSTYLRSSHAVSCFRQAGEKEKKKPGEKEKRKRESPPVYRVNDRVLLGCKRKKERKEYPEGKEREKRGTRLSIKKRKCSSLFLRGRGKNRLFLSLFQGGKKKIFHEKEVGPFSRKEEGEEGGKG